MSVVISKQLNNTANEIEDKLYNIKNNIKEIEAIIDGIPQIWGGTDAIIFSKKYLEVLTELKKCCNSFDNYNDYLKGVYNVFSSLEEAYDKPIDIN